LDNLSTQTGITRFLELNRNSGWLYNKSENLTQNDLIKFSHLLIEADFSEDKKLEPFKYTHNIIDFIRSFNGIYFTNDPIPIPRIRWVPKLFILKKKPNIV
jgi:hypothetical protein